MTRLHDREGCSASQSYSFYWVLDELRLMAAPMGAHVTYTTGWDVSTLPGRGSVGAMTINQEQQQVLQENWRELRERVQGEFPEVDPSILEAYQGDLAQIIAGQTSTGVAEVEAKLSQVVQEYQGQQGGQNQGQDDQTQPVSTDPDAGYDPNTPDQGMSVAPPPNQGTIQPDAETQNANAPKR